MVPSRPSIPICVLKLDHNLIQFVQGRTRREKNMDTSMRRRDIFQNSPDSPGSADFFDVTQRETRENRKWQVSCWRTQTKQGEKLLGASPRTSTCPVDPSPCWDTNGNCTSYVTRGHHFKPDGL